MKKKIISLCLVVCLLATAIVGGTLAYFTDTDSATNVMTLGNVKIVQNEEQRPLDQIGQPNENATELEDFEQGKPIYPAVKDNTVPTLKDGSITDTDDATALAIWNKSMKNEIDKFVSVTNKGTEDAYVRTILLFETVRSYKENSSTEWVDLHDHFFLINGDFDYLRATETTDDDTQDFTYVTIGDKEYAVAVKTYTTPLNPGKTTTASLRQFALTWDAGNEVYDFFGPTYEIFALSQAAQTAGFASAEEALNTAFGEVDATNVAAWFAGSTGVIATPATGAVRPAGYVPVADEEGNAVVNGVTVVDNSDDETNLRALTNVDDDKNITNLDVIGCDLQGTYAMNVYGNGTGVLTVADTTIDGWVSFTDFKSASFTNVDFVTDKDATAKDKDGNPLNLNIVRSYVAETTITDCSFTENYRFDTAEKAGTFIFENCYINNVLVTAANVASFFDVDNCGAGTIAIVDGIEVTIK